ncbi:WecA-like glycosyltransferase [Lacipirellula limnantheis]|uniref:WecA-like glycosyltransferase n=2 Tax=Lacipirellula limnantheis TaxID=2528024 RepID=A0A517TUA7_9BACT|nr:WecA-like glycosyltransferase [Lacipirellula limnantheis]
MQYVLTMSCIAAIVSYPLTHFVASLAQRWGFVDRPDGHHKSHKKPVALGGGLAVFLAAVVTFAVEYFSSENLQESLHDNAPFLSGLLLACGWIVVLGLIDDRYGMKGRYKLVGQTIAALIVIASGLEIQAFSLFGQKIQLGWFSVPFTLFWLVGAINSLNLLDGIDGLATTIGIILCSAITVMALWFGQPAVAIVSAVFAGALLGFLRFNFPPATIYLGDAGSMLIGLIVGSLAIGASLKGPATVAMAAPLAIWSLPMFDSFIAILRRKLTGRSIYATDRGHLHHRLMARFGKNTRVLGVVALCCAVTCTGALLSMFMQNDLLAVGSVMLVICILVATQIFGHVEFLMLANRMKSVGMSVIKPSTKSGSWQSSVRLQGTREWDMLWQSLIEYAEKSQLVEVLLDLNLAAIQEAYHASWKRRTRCERRELWRTEVPLFVDQHVVGRLTVAGEREEGQPVCDMVSRLMELLAVLEADIVSLASTQRLEVAGSLPEVGSTKGDPLAASAASSIPSSPPPHATIAP